MSIETAANAQVNEDDDDDDDESTGAGNRDRTDAAASVKAYTQSIEAIANEMVEKATGIKDIIGSTSNGQVEDTKLEKKIMKEEGFPKEAIDAVFPPPANATALTPSATAPSNAQTPTASSAAASGASDTASDTASEAASGAAPEAASSVTSDAASGAA